jgi:phospholipase C
LDRRAFLKRSAALAFVAGGGLVAASQKMLPSLAGVSAALSDPARGLSSIKHIVVIMEENHTFDNYFGTFPGANGIAGASPQPATSSPNAQLVGPYAIDTTTIAHDLPHTWAAAHQAYDGGKMDGFVIASNSNLSMGYFKPALVSSYWDYASRFVLLDNFYTSVMGPSLPNHLYLIAGQSGGLTSDGTSGVIDFTSSTVHDNTFYFQTIMDELDANLISWRYYAGGYSYLNNWNPLPGFASFKSDPTRMANLAPPTQLITDMANHALASVVWVMPGSDQSSEHPPHDISVGEQDTVSIINAIMASDTGSRRPSFSPGTTTEAGTTTSDRRRWTPSATVSESRA